MKNKIIKLITWIILLFLVLLAISIIAISTGTSKIPFKIVTACLFLQGKNCSITDADIILKIRMPRILLGFAVGSALSLCGVILQGMFRNPLVEPYTLGISGGAALGVCLCIALGLNKNIGIIAIPYAGLIGAGCVIFIIYLLNVSRGRLKIHGLLLSGVMVSFICASLFMLIMAIVGAEDLQGIIFWTMGTLEQPVAYLIKVMMVVSVGGLIIASFFSKELNAFSLGAEQALHLGVNTERIMMILFFTTSILTGVSVSVAGIIGFVGWRKYRRDEYLE